MPYWEDYYQILGIAPRSAAKEIRAAWRRKALDLHPDRLSQVPEAVRQSAQEELKKVNRAYEVLRDDEKRRSYYADWLRSNSPPSPVVEPSVIVFSDAKPGERRTGFFVIRNDGGAYKSIWVSDPESWVKVAMYSSLELDDELPLQVEIAASGQDWGKHYTERIVVRLDGVETAVRVQLHTKAAVAPPGSIGLSGWVKGVIASGVAALAIFAIISVMATPEERRSPVGQSWYSGYQTNSSVTQPWSAGFQTNSHVNQPWSSGFQTNSRTPVQLHWDSGKPFWVPDKVYCPSDMVVWVSAQISILVFHVPAQLPVQPDLAIRCWALLYRRNRLPDRRHSVGVSCINQAPPFLCCHSWSRARS